MHEMACNAQASPTQFPMTCPSFCAILKWVCFEVVFGYSNRLWLLCKLPSANVRADIFTMLYSLLGFYLMKKLPILQVSRERQQWFTIAL